VALAVNPSVAARNVNELVALAKSKPRGLTLASAGTGSAGHMAAIREFGPSVEHRKTWLTRILAGGSDAVGKEA
jgi:hypothetical protein